MSCSGQSSQGTLATSSVERRDEIYLLVFTIAKRLEPFANVRPTRVTVLFSGAKELIRPVTPVLLVDIMKQMNHAQHTERKQKYEHV